MNNLMNSVNRLLPTHAAANKSQLTMLLNNIPVTVLRGQLNEKLNDTYVGNFVVKSDSLLPVQSFIGKKASFAMDVNNEIQSFHLIVTNVLGMGGEEYAYHIWVESPLWLMAHYYRSRSFTDMSVQAVFKVILSQYAFLSSDVLCKLSNNDNHSYFEQHQCSDRTFFQRMVAEQGLRYYFIHDVDRVSICIEDQTNKTSTLPVLSVPFLPGLTSNQTQYKVDDLKEWHGVDALNESIEGIEMFCNIPSLIPGVVFELTQHPDTRFNRQYRVIESLHQWDETSSEPLVSSDISGLRYQHTVKAVSVLAATRAHDQSALHVVSHLSIANVKGVGIQPNLTDQGEYFVQHVDMPITHLHQDIAPVRQTQTMVGNDCGIHFPLLKDAEVLMARLNGHPDKPVILGALYNEANKNPVADKNAYHNVLKTNAGHVWLMDDTPNAQKILIETPLGENQFLMDASSSAAGVLLSSTKGGLDLSSAQGSILSAGKSLSMDAQEDMLFSAHAISMAASDKAITMDAAGDLLLSAGNTLLLDVQENISAEVSGNFSHHVKENYDLTCAGTYALVAQEGDVQLQSSDSQVVFLAQKGGIRMEVGETSFIFDDAGECFMKTTTMNLSANTINVDDSGSVSAR